jgi:hypothetical protein
MLRYNQQHRLRLASWIILLSIPLLGEAKETIRWTEGFNLPKHPLVTTGNNEYFILQPGYQLTLTGEDSKDSLLLKITVLEDTIKIGEVWTRVIEEREWGKGELKEISRNYFAFCPTCGSIFYFGEDVDNFKAGKLVNHSGSWRANQEGARAGLMMPGIALLGARYYEEIAPGVAMDRGEVVSLEQALDTPAGNFRNCLKIEETSAMEPGKEYKVYASGVGLIRDAEFVLTSYGYQR